MFSLSEAARQTNQSKSTIWRAVKNGRMSATRTDTGEFQIDPAELFRVFEVKPPAETAANVAVTQAATAETPTETLLRAEIASLRRMGELLRSQLDDVREDRNAWKDQAKRMALPVPPPAPEKRGWFRRRLVG